METKVIHDGCQPATHLARSGLEDELDTVLPADEPAVEVRDSSVLGLVELLLKNPRGADALSIQEDGQAKLIPRFLGIALASYVLFAVAMIVILNAAAPEAYPKSPLPVPPADWRTGTALALLLAYNIGLVAATCICLPSFYFFALLAGVKLSMLQIVGQILRSKASAALVLIGILPIYVAIVLGMAVFGAPVGTMEFCLSLGLVLPFLAGFEGVRTIYRGVHGMAGTMPEERRTDRACFLRRLTLSWAAVYTAVSPVMIYRLWELLAGAIESLRVAK